MIDAGYIYIAQPPLYKIKKGKEILYAYTDDEKIKIVGLGADVSEIQPADDEALAGEEVESENETEIKAKSNKVHIQRFKGLRRNESGRTLGNDDGSCSTEYSKK